MDYVFLFGLVFRKGLHSVGEVLEKIQLFSGMGFFPVTDCFEPFATVGLE